MNQAEFRRTRELFDAALEQPRPQRRAFLEGACGPDADLIERVERLLQHTEVDRPSRTEDRGAEGGPPPDPAPPRAASVGEMAPDFDLPCVSADASRGRAVLSDYGGRWLLLVFYPRDFSLICPTELTALSKRSEEFRNVGASILGVSVDSIESHERWLTTPKGRGGLGGLDFPLASDVEASVSRAYGVYLEQQHLALRGAFIIDPNGVLQYQAVHNMSVGRRTDDILRVMHALQTGGLCPEDWTRDLAAVDPTEALGNGSIVSHYRIEGSVGRGASACVFRAQDTTLKRTVALKVIKPESPLSASEVLDEARAAAALSHTNICTVYAVDDSEGIPFIAMEYVDGRPLSEVLDDELLPPARAAEIGRQVATGMAAAHEMGVSHGDLKPANVVVRDDGIVKVLDFGLARPEVPDPEATTLLGAAGTPRTPGMPPTPGTRPLRGTPAYMSPEQTTGGRATREGDVFSLGVLLYEMLTGTNPFRAPTIPDILRQVRAVEPDRLAADVPDPFASVLRRALARDERDRTITMREIAETLGAAI